MTPRVFITPKGDSLSESKIVSLAHPKTGVPTRYLVQNKQIHRNSIVADGCIYLCTPQDLLFHLLPVLKTHTSTHSLPLDHIIDLLPTSLQQCTSPTLLQRLCTCTKSTNPTLIPDTFSLSHERVLNILLRKVNALIPVLGDTLVAEYVDKPLALVIGQERPCGWEGIRELGLRRCAMELVAQNLDEEFSIRLFATTDFEPLDRYLKELEEARHAAAAATLMIPNGESNGNAEKRAAAKDELDGEKAKKKGKVSQGVKALEKVNTRGMKDMRSFFSKKTVKTKA